MQIFHPYPLTRVLDSYGKDSGVSLTFSTLAWFSTGNVTFVTDAGRRMK